jgi:hypothetical protein
VYPPPSPPHTPPQLLIIPFVCVVELVYMGRKFNKPTVLSILTVVAGVAIV